MYRPLLLALLSTSVFAAIHNIRVGEDDDNDNEFEPDDIRNVRAGDFLVFHLNPNHDVVQSAFDTPCRPSQGGFYSGPYSGTDNGRLKFVVNVTNEDPMFWYCSVERHCQDGMVGGANVPNSGDTLDAYEDAAESVAQSERPSQVAGGELLDDEQISALTNGTSSATPTGSASRTSTTTSTEGPSATGGSAPSPTGAAATVSVDKGATSIFGLVLALAGWML